LNTVIRPTSAASLAFLNYNTTLRPFIEQVQAAAVNFGLKFMIPRTAEAILDRNSQAPSR
jgi:hypothetical protein